MFNFLVNFIIYSTLFLKYVPFNEFHIYLLTKCFFTLVSSCQTIKYLIYTQFQQHSSKHPSAYLCHPKIN